jgi:hypothetical protein
MKPRDLLQDGQKVLFRYKKTDYVAIFETARGGLVYGDRVFTGFHDFIGILTIESGQCRPYIENGVERLPKQLVGNLWNRLRVCVGTNEWVRLASLREAELSRRNFTYHYTSEPTTPRLKTPVVDTTETTPETTETTPETTKTTPETTETTPETTETPVDTTETPVDTTETHVDTTETPVDTTETAVVRPVVKIRIVDRITRMEEKFDRVLRENEKLRERNRELELGMRLIASYATKKIKVKIGKKKD